MPRKTRRKTNTNPSVENKIPFAKYRVEWVDCVSDSGWADEKEDDGSFTFGDRMMIPASWVKKMTKIQ